MFNKIKNKKSKIKISFILLGITTWLLPSVGFCDILRLREIPEGKEGNEVEILEERGFLKKN